MPKTHESHLEQHVLNQLKDLGYSYMHGDKLDPEVARAERLNYHAATLAQTLRSAVGKINASLPAAALDSAVHQALDVQLTELPLSGSARSIFTISTKTRVPPRET